MTIKTSEYWGFSVFEGWSNNRWVGPNVLRTYSSVGVYTPTNVSTNYGPPIGANTLVDYPPEKFYEGPFSRKSWAWFLRQVHALGQVGSGMRIPLALDFEKTEMAWLLSESAYFLSHPNFPITPWLLNPKLLLALHDFLNQVNAVEITERPKLWSRPWFEQAVEVLRAGWAWKITNNYSQSFYMTTASIGGRIRAGNALLGVPVGDSFDQNWSVELTEPASVEWSASGNTGDPLHHDYSGQVSGQFTPEHADSEFPGHITGYLFDCAAQITGPSGTVQAESLPNTASAFAQSGATIEGIYFSSGSARISAARKHFATQRDHTSYTHEESSGPA